MNFFHYKDLGNHLLQLCPKVVKHPVYCMALKRSVITGLYVGRVLRVIDVNFVE